MECAGEGRRNGASEKVNQPWSGCSTPTPSPSVGQDPQDVRAERVRELKKQIAEGTYEPDPREIARKLLESGF
jgi:flagellar biosynthesis anti-sigma factor FlgM